MHRPTLVPLDQMKFPLTLAVGLRTTFAEVVSIPLLGRLATLVRRLNADRLDLLGDLRSLTAALFEDEKLDTIECESAEAALAVMLIGGREVAMVADIRLGGIMDGIDAHEVKVRWPLLPVVLTSRHPLERIRDLPPGVAYMPKPWQPLNVLVVAEQALASARGC
jgi:hypothetical protein